MAAVEQSKIPKQEHDELCCVYAALALHDAGIEINVKNIKYDDRKRK